MSNTEVGSCANRGVPAAACGGDAAAAPAAAVAAAAAPAAPPACLPRPAPLPGGRLRGAEHSQRARAQLSARGVFVGLVRPPGKCRRALPARGRGSECKCGQCARRRQGSSGGVLAQRAAERGQCRAAWGSGRAWRNVGRSVRAMHWPVPRGGDAELVTWPTVAWLLRRVSATNPNAARSEQTSCGRRPPPVLPRTWGTTEVLRYSNPPCARHDLGLWPIVVAGNTEID